MTFLGNTTTMTTTTTSAPTTDDITPAALVVLNETENKNTIPGPKINCPIRCDCGCTG
jgi:hypothetical protein